MVDWYRNSEAVDSVPIDDRAIHYGDGLFETIAIRGGQPRLWDLHMQRLQMGCQRLGLEPPDATRLRESLANALEAADVDTSYALAKVIVSAGSGPRGYRRETSASPGALVGVFAAQRLPQEYYRDGIAVMQCTTTIANQPALAGLKTLNRLEQVLARNEWHDPDIFEGLMCNAEKRVICGTMSNVFILRDNSIATPKLSQGGVAGVMRQHIINTLDSKGESVEVRDIPASDAMRADTIFICNSQFGILPVREWGGDTFPITPQLQDIVAAIAESGIEELRT